jgi:hypothetical protein
MLCYGIKYVDKGVALHQAQHRQLQIEQRNRKAVQPGISTSEFQRLKKHEFLGRLPVTNRHNFFEAPFPANLQIVDDLPSE